LPLNGAIALAVIVGGFIVPLLLYRLSWSWWLMINFFWSPHKLPANSAEPENDPKDK
jgi:hypothetical protein